MRSDSQEARIIPLRDRHGNVKACAQLDADDFARIGHYRWYLRPGGYAARQVTIGRKKQQTILLHRDVMGLKVGDGMCVDHINHDPLDCRRSNLRVVSHAQNHQNRTANGNRGGSSQYRGVSFNKANRKWRASAKVDRKQYFLGDFESEEEAARVAAEFRAHHMPLSTN